MWKQGDGAQNPQLFSISTRLGPLGHQPIQSLTANSIARERWEYNHLVILGRRMRGRSATAPLPTLPIFDTEGIPSISKAYLWYRRYELIFDIEVHFFDIDAHNLIFDIEALSSISKVEKDIRCRVITFDIVCIRYRVRYTQKPEETSISKFQETNIVCIWYRIRFCIYAQYDIE